MTEDNKEKNGKNGIEGRENEKEGRQMRIGQNHGVAKAKTCVNFNLECSEYTLIELYNYLSGIDLVQHLI